MGRYLDSIRGRLESDSAAMGVSKASVDEFLSKAANNVNFISSGPMSMSGDRMPFARPTLAEMEPLAKALGLDREGGWVGVWKTMARERDRLCRFVSLSYPLTLLPVKQRRG